MQNSSLRLAACLLNISEGRSKQIVEKVAQSAISLSSKTNLKCASTVLNIFSDHDYNRSVITIAAPIDQLEDSVYRACETAYEYIDLSKHYGGHPRLGSVDLIPIHPIDPCVNLKECGQIAQRIGRRIVETIKGTSVFFFGHADNPKCCGLVARRKEVNWYAGKGGMIFDSIGYDIGAPPSARYGCTGVGAIPYVTNCNVTINTSDVSLGRSIAQTIRAKTPGGFPGVQAMAFAHEGMVEIACNVEAYESISEEGKFQYTSADQIENRVQELAARAGVETFGTKIVGFTPEESYQRAEYALIHGISDAWRTAGTIRM